MKREEDNELRLLLESSRREETAEAGGRGTAFKECTGIGGHGEDWPRGGPGRGRIERKKETGRAVGE